MNDLYELDLETIPWRRDSVDLNWQIVDNNGNILASGSWQDQNSGTRRVTLTRYRPRPGLRQRVLVTVPHSVMTSDASPALSLYCPEAALAFADGMPFAVGWAALLTLGAVLLFIPTVLRAAK
jgi:hypothetical protein